MLIVFLCQPAVIATRLQIVTGRGHLMIDLAGVLLTAADPSMQLCC